MIVRFRHKGLQRFFEAGDHRGIDAKHAARIRHRLDASTGPQDMNLPGFGFHPLKGNRKGAYDVSLEDYH